MNARQITALTLLIATVAVIAFGAGHRTASDAVRESAPTTVALIQEDDPSWDCKTMGNHICGSYDLTHEDTRDCVVDDSCGGPLVRVGATNDGVIVRIGDNSTTYIAWEDTTDCTEGHPVISTTIPPIDDSWVCQP